MRGLYIKGPSLMGAPSVCGGCGGTFDVVLDCHLRAEVARTVILAGALLKEIGFGSAKLRFGVFEISAAQVSDALPDDSRISPDEWYAALTCANPLEGAAKLAPLMPEKYGRETMVTWLRESQCAECRAIGCGLISLEVLVERRRNPSNSSVTELRGDDGAYSTEDALARKWVASHQSDMGPVGRAEAFSARDVAHAWQKRR